MRALPGAVLGAALALAGLSASPARADLDLVPVPEPDLQAAGPRVQALMRRTGERLREARRSPDLPAPRLAEAFADAAQVYHAHDLHGPAEAAYRNAMALAPEDHRWPYLLARLLVHEGRLDEAAGLLARLRQRRPDNPLLSLRLGQALQALGRSEQARPLLREAGAEPRLRAGADYALGRLALQERDYAAAAAHLQAALAAQPRAERVHVPLAAAYRGMGRMDAARAHIDQRGEGTVQVPDPLLERVRAQASGVRAHLRRAKQAWSEQDLSTAAAELEAALALVPTDVLMRVRLARVHYLMGARQAVREHLVQARELDPAHPSVNRLLGLLAEEDGRDEPAARRYATAAAREPGHALNHLLLGNALMRLGRYAEAAPAYARVLELAPHSRRVRLLRALALVGAGREAEAQGLLEQALEIFPGDPAFTEALARLLAASRDERLRDPVRALQMAQRLESGRAALEALDTRAMARAAGGSFEQAVALQRRFITLAQAQGRVDLLPGARANLRRYQGAHPALSPWPHSNPALSPPATSIGEFLSARHAPVPRSDQRTQ